MGKVQSTLLTITFVAWTSNAVCPGTFTAIDPATNVQCENSASGANDHSECCTDACIISGLTFSGANDCDDTTLATATAAWFLAKEAYNAQLLNDAIAASNNLLYTNITSEMEDYADGEDDKHDADLQELLESKIATAKGEAILEALNHDENFKQDDHEGFKEQLALTMAANANSVKADVKKAESAADDAEDSAKAAAISALDSKGYAADAKKDKDDSDDILSSIKKLVEGWIGHSHGGCSQPPCSQPCQYSAMNPMYYYHC